MIDDEINATALSQRKALGWFREFHSKLRNKDTVTAKSHWNTL